MYTAQQKKDHIREIQTYLHFIARTDGSIPAVIPDGIYGDETKAAVTAFQRLYSLPLTGEVDKGTWDRIVLVYRELSKTPQPVFFFPSKNYIIRDGDKGVLVYLVQIMLNELAVRYRNLSAVDVNGIYGRNTADAVKDWQKISRIEQTGNTDLETWNMLADAFSKLDLSR